MSAGEQGTLSRRYASFVLQHLMARTPDQTRSIDAHSGGLCVLAGISSRDRCRPKFFGPALAGARIEGTAGARARRPRCHDADSADRQRFQDACPAAPAWAGRGKGLNLMRWHDDTGNLVLRLPARIYIPYGKDALRKALGITASPCASPGDLTCQTYAHVDTVVALSVWAVSL